MPIVSIEPAMLLVFRERFSNVLSLARHLKLDPKRKLGWKRISKYFHKASEGIKRTTTSTTLLPTAIRSPHPSRAVDSHVSYYPRFPGWFATFLRR